LASNVTQSAFGFEAGTAENAATIATWIGDRRRRLPVDLIAAFNLSRVKLYEGQWYYLRAQATVVADGGVYVAVEDCEITVLITLLQHAMNTMPEVKSGQGFSWAITCSEMRCGEFGGGAVWLVRGMEPKIFTTAQ
jgi:hypothetical protein